MNTVFCLVYLECSTRTRNIDTALVGPIISSTRESAIDAVFGYVKNRINDGLSDVFDNYVESSSEFEELGINGTWDLINNDYDEKLALVNYYFDSVDEDDMHSYYEIKELPTSSFIEQLQDADAIEIDGNFVRNFNLLTPEDVAGGDLGSYVEAHYADNELDIQYEFNLEQVKGAYFDPNARCWNVDGHYVNLVKFAK